MTPRTVIRILYGVMAGMCVISAAVALQRPLQLVKYSPFVDRLLLYITLTGFGLFVVLAGVAAHLDFHGRRTGKIRDSDQPKLTWEEFRERRSRYLRRWLTVAACVFLPLAMVAYFFWGWNFWFQLGWMYLMSILGAAGHAKIFQCPQCEKLFGNPFVPSCAQCGLPKNVENFGADAPRTR